MIIHALITQPGKELSHSMISAEYAVLNFPFLCHSLNISV